MYAIAEIIQWNNSTFQYMFHHSPQVKQVNKLCIWVPSQVYYDMRVRKYYKNFKIRWRQSLVPSLPFRNKIFVIAAKNYAKLNLKVFWSCPICLISLISHINLFPRLYVYKQKFVQSNIQGSIHSNSDINIHSLTPRDT